MSVLAIIPARGGSKGLPGKHLRMLAGKPLIAWTLEAALSARCIDHVVVTSDDSAILQVAQQTNRRACVRTLLRPSELAQDDTPSEPVVAHALKACADIASSIVVLLQPTSPLRTAEDIRQALDKLKDNAADAVISVFEPPHSPYKCFIERHDGCLSGAINDNAPFQPRQSLPRAWMPNGAIYAVRTARFERTGRLFGERTLPYVMSAARSVDIDIEADLAQAEQWIGREQLSREQRLGREQRLNRKQWIDENSETNQISNEGHEAHHSAQVIS